jgi:hypothetical protein
MAVAADPIKVLARLAKLSTIADEYTRRLCDIGPKYAGTPGELAARDFIAGVLRQTGYTPKVESFRCKSSS